MPDEKESCCGTGLRGGPAPAAGSCCCGPASGARADTARSGCAGGPDSVPVPDSPGSEAAGTCAPWIAGEIDSAAGPVPTVRTRLSLRDRLGALAARCTIGRMRYRVHPGLYAAGRPGPESPVLVSANYKMSFDRLRSVLGGRNAWILVLDTRGINVWCAAGKGTFGTAEIVKRVEAGRLERIVSHRRLVVPQLGAPGVSAHEVRERCGFRVEYGPVRAEDLPSFLDAGMKASPEMRRVRFGLEDRAVLIPVEVVTWGRFALPAAAALLALGALGGHGNAAAGIRAAGVPGALLTLAAFLAGSVLGPLLLPWLPGRAFAVKGAVLGLALTGALAAAGRLTGSPVPPLHLAAWLLLAPAITSFVLMNFTGATTFTSMSGVLREMRFAVPAQIAAAALGLGLWIAGLFLSGGRLA